MVCGLRDWIRGGRGGGGEGGMVGHNFHEKKNRLMLENFRLVSMKILKTLCACFFGMQAAYAKQIINFTWPNPKMNHPHILMIHIFKSSLEYNISFLECY